MRASLRARTIEQCAVEIDRLIAHDRSVNFGLDSILVPILRKAAKNIRALKRQRKRV